MKKEMFVMQDIWALFGLPVLSFVSSIILLILREWFPALFCFLLGLLFTIPLVIWRKLFFAKIRLTDEGVCRFFGDEIINKICWNDIVEVRVLAKRCVYFLDKPYDEKVIPLNYKTNICFNLTKKNFANLLQFKEKFKDKITDISLLSESQKRLLLD